MKVKCIIEYQIKNDMDKLPYNIQPSEASYYMEKSFEHHIRLLICRVNKKGNVKETLKAGDWFKREFINQQTYIHYAGLSFMYHQNNNEITVCDSIFKV